MIKGFFFTSISLVRDKGSNMNDLLKFMKLDSNRGHILFQNTTAMLFPSEYTALETNGKSQMGRKCLRAKKEILILHKVRGELNCETKRLSRSCPVEFLDWDD